MQEHAAGLRAFERSVRTDPLFAAEGLDLENAERALDALEQWTDEYEKIWKQYAFTYRIFSVRYPLRETLYPVAFLHAFLESERIRRAFLAAPSEDTAHVLIAQHQKTVETLFDDINSFRAAHKMALRIEGERENGDSIFYFFDTAVTFKELLASIDRLEENARALLAEIGRRKAILAGTDRTEPAPARSDPIPYRPEAPALSPDLTALARLEEKRAYAQMEVEAHYGPFLYETSAFDASPTYHQFEVYLGTMKRDGLQYQGMRVHTPDVHFFLDIRPSSYNLHLDRALFGPLIERGLPYWHQGTTNWYCVRDVGFYADLATVVDRIRRPELSEAAVVSQKSSLLDRLLWYGASNAEMNILQSKMLAREGRLASLVYLYVARSHASFFYLPFNRSVWRLPERLTFPGGRFNYERTPYLPYASIKDALTPPLLQQIFDAPAVRRRAWEKTLAA